MKLTKKTSLILAGMTILTSTAFAQILPDLTVKDVFMDDNSKVIFNLANQSSDAVDPNQDGFVYVYVDGKVAWTYNWKYLKETGFLNADGSSVITSQIPKGNGVVKVCVDVRNNVNETDESNNCFEAKLTMPNVATSVETDSDLPDLAITNISVDPFNGNLIIEQGNIGKGHISDYNGNVNIYVDSKLRWTYNYSSMNKQFLNPGFTGKITPNNIVGEHEVTACTSTRSIIEEVSKENNCLTKIVSDVNPSRYVRTRKAVNGNLIQYRTRSIGLPASNTSYYRPDFKVTNVYLGTDGKVYATIVNKGVKHYQNTVGEVTFYLDGRRQSSSSWTSFSNLDFLNAGGKSDLQMYDVLTGSHELKVCVDEGDNVREQNENNNCFSTLLP